MGNHPSHANLGSLENQNSVAVNNAPGSFVQLSFQNVVTTTGGVQPVQCQYQNVPYCAVRGTTNGTVSLVYQGTTDNNVAGALLQILGPGNAVLASSPLPMGTGARATVGTPGPIPYIANVPVSVALVIPASPNPYQNQSTTLHSNGTFTMLYA